MHNVKVQVSFTFQRPLHVECKDFVGLYSCLNVEANGAPGNPVQVTLLRQQCSFLLLLKSCGRHKAVLLFEKDWDHV